MILHLVFSIIICFQVCFNLFACETKSPSVDAQKWQGNFYDKNSDPQFYVATQALEKYNFKGIRSILDIGCGSGKVTNVLAQLAPSARIVAIDASRSMVQAARQKYNQKNIKYAVADAQKLNYKNKFDLVVSFSCIHWIKDKAQLFDAIASALKKSGKVLIVASGHDPKDPLMQAFLSLKKIKPWDKLMAKINYAEQFFPINKVEVEKILASRFKKFSVKEKTLPINFSDEREFAQWLAGWSGGIEVVANLPVEKKQKLLREVIKQYLKLKPVGVGGAIDYGWKYVVIEVIK